MRVVRGLTCLSGAAFIAYGVLCLASLSMVQDFHRFGLERLRYPTGVLEVLGGVGLLIGLVWRPALLAASFGLALLMLIAFGVRVGMRDSVALSLPSLLLMLVNGYIFVRTLST
ncbi:MAG: DoxX family protein [Janthinobacterium lividum]